MILGIMGAMPDEVDQLCAKLENVTVEPYGGVVINSLEPGDPLYREDLVKSVYAGGSVF